MEAPDSTPVNSLIAAIVRNVIEDVRTLASREDQLQYEKDVPIADVPSELVCGWDLFEGNKSDLKAHLRPDQFQSLQQIEDAIDHFLSAEDHWKINSVADLHQHSRWPAVIEAAAKALPLLNPDPVL
jgi:hypothetical protein